MILLLFIIMKNFLIDLLAWGTIFSSVLVIVSVNPVIAVIFLIAVFCNAAGFLILLGVGFIGISYIILYVGAITVLFLFVIMMFNIKLSDILDYGNQYTKILPLGFMVVSLILYYFFTISPILFDNFGDTIYHIFDYFNINSSILLSDINQNLNLSDYEILDSSIKHISQIKNIGFSLYIYEAILFIIVSLILLFAMVSAIIISSKTYNN